MFGIFFTDAETVTCYQDVVKCDVERFKRFFPSDAGGRRVPGAVSILRLALCPSPTAKKISTIPSTPRVGYLPNCKVLECGDAGIFPDAAHCALSGLQIAQRCSPGKAASTGMLRPSGIVSGAYNLSK